MELGSWERTGPRDVMAASSGQSDSHPHLALAELDNEPSLRKWGRCSGTT